MLPPLRSLRLRSSCARASLVLAVLILGGPLAAYGGVEPDAGVAGAQEGGSSAGPSGDAAVEERAAAPEGGVADDAAPAAILPRGAGAVAAADGGATEPTQLVHGTVVAKGTREALVGASLWLDGQAVGETDEHGSFSLNVASRGQTLTIQHPGYALLKTPVPFPRGTEDEVIRLEPISRGERYVTEIRSPPPAPVIRVEGEEARQVAGSAGDPFRVVGTLPGVSQLAWPAAVYVVRGANPGNTGFFVDGLRVPALFHLGLGPSIIHPYLIEGLDFFPGAYPAQYGRYVSGIVAARTSVPPADRVHASADLTVYDAGGIVTTPIDGGRGTFAAAGRYSYTGALLSLVRSDTKVGYADYQVRLDDRVGPGTFTAFALGSWDVVGWVASMEQQGSLQYHRLDLRYTMPLLGGRWLSGVTVGHDRAQSNLFYSPIGVKSYDVAPRMTYDRSLGGWGDLKLGLDAEAQIFRTTKFGLQGQQGDLTRPRQALQLGAFLSLGLKLGSRLRVVPGVRVDDFREEATQEMVLEPRLSAFLSLTDHLGLQGAIGRFAQMPSLPVSVPGFESFGLQSLGLQRSDAASLGVTASAGPWELGVTGYLQRMTLTDIRNIELEGMNPTRPDYLVLRDGTSYGLETLLRKRNEGRTFGWLAYTLSWSRRTVDGVVGPSDFDQRHVLNLVGGHRLGRGVTLGGRVHLHTGRNAPIYGRPVPEDPDTSRRLPTYFQLDLRAEKRFVFDKVIADLFLDLGNALFRQEAIEWRRDENTGVVRANVFHIILPTIGLHLVY